MANITDTLKGRTLAVALKTATGQEPRVMSYPDYVRLEWSKAQQAALRADLDRQLSSKPGRIRVDISPVLTPYIIRKAIPWAVAAVFAGYLAGKMI